MGWIKLLVPPRIFDSLQPVFPVLSRAIYIAHQSTTHQLDGLRVLTQTSLGVLLQISQAQSRRIQDSTLLMQVLTSIPHFS